MRAGERETCPLGPLVRKPLYLVSADRPPDPPDDDITDEELELEELARQVEADARPLFFAALLEIVRRALTHDENDEDHR